MFIKQPPKYRYISGSKEHAEIIWPTMDNLGAKIRVTVGELLNGDKEGELVTEIKANQIVKISAPLSPYKFTGLLGFNPKLAELADVSISPVLEAGEEVSLCLKARKAINLDDLPYIFKLWIVE